MNYGVISLLVPIAVIILAMVTKKIISSLILGILFGGILLSGGNIVKGVVLAVEHLVKTIANEESIYVIMFLFVFGAFGEIMKVSGGIKGFSKIADKYIESERGALMAVWAASLVTFIDCCFHAIATGTIGKALIEKTKGSKEKLAIVVNITSCLLIILIPFGTTYVGYIVGVISSSLSKASLNGSAYLLYLRSIPYNFYAIIMILISIGIIVFNVKFENQVKENIARETHGHEHEAHEQCEFEEKAPPRPFNLIIPLFLLITTTFFFFWYICKIYNKFIGYQDPIDIYPNSYFSNRMRSIIFYGLGLGNMGTYHANCSTNCSIKQYKPAVSYRICPGRRITGG